MNTHRTHVSPAFKLALDADLKDIASGELTVADEAQRATRLRLWPELGWSPREAAILAEFVKMTRPRPVPAGQDAFAVPADLSPFDLRRWPLSVQLPSIEIVVEFDDGFEPFTLRVEGESRRPNPSIRIYGAPS